MQTLSPHTPDDEIEAAELQRERVRAVLVYLRTVSDAELYRLAERLADANGESLVQTLRDVRQFYAETRQLVEETARRYGLPV